MLGIAASGTTPYVIGGLKDANQAGITTACICCNPGSPLAQEAQYPIEVVVGPEFITGSTRMKSGTAQKLILNMISSATMIKLGRVEDNSMVDMQLTNNKLLERGTRMVMEALQLDEAEALVFNRLVSIEETWYFTSYMQSLAAGSSAEGNDLVLEFANLLLENPGAGRAFLANADSGAEFRSARGVEGADYVRFVGLVRRELDMLGESLN